MVKIFMKCTHRLRGQNNFLILIEPDFHCLADEIAESRPDMDIKVTVFTVSEKSMNIYTEQEKVRQLF